MVKPIQMSNRIRRAPDGRGAGRSTFSKRTDGQQPQRRDVTTIMQKLRAAAEGVSNPGNQTRVILQSIEQGDLPGAIKYALSAGKRDRLGLIIQAAVAIGKPTLAAPALQEQGEFFELAKVEMSELFRIMGQLYQEEHEPRVEKTLKMTMRDHLKHAIDAYLTTIQDRLQKPFELTEVTHHIHSRFLEYFTQILGDAGQYEYLGDALVKIAGLLQEKAQSKEAGLESKMTLKNLAISFVKTAIKAYEIMEREEKAEHAEHSRPGSMFINQDLLDKVMAAKDLETALFKMNMTVAPPTAEEQAKEKAGKVGDQTLELAEEKE